MICIHINLPLLKFPVFHSPTVFLFCLLLAPPFPCLPLFPSFGNFHYKMLMSSTILCNVLSIINHNKHKYITIIRGPVVVRFWENLIWQIDSVCPCNLFMGHINSVIIILYNDMIPIYPPIKVRLFSFFLILFWEAFNFFVFVFIFIKIGFLNQYHKCCGPYYKLSNLT